MNQPKWWFHGEITYKNGWLVVWTMNGLWLSYWECHHPNWRTPSFFRGFETTNQRMEIQRDLGSRLWWFSRCRDGIAGYFLGGYDEVYQRYVISFEFIWGSRVQTEWTIVLIHNHIPITSPLLLTQCFVGEICKSPWPMLFWLLNPNYPLVNIQKAIENGPVEIVDFPIFIAWWFSHQFFC